MLVTTPVGVGLETSTSRILDVTGTLAPGMWSYRPLIPDIPEFTHHRFATVAERGWEADSFSCSTLTGTYLETSKHYYPDRTSIDLVPAERLFLDAVVLQVPRQAREHITLDAVRSVSPELRSGDALLIATGWDRHWWDRDLFVMESPHFERAAMEWLVERGVALVGGDFPCFDDPQPDQAEGVNIPLFAANRLILAPLVGLTQIDQKRVRLIALPIKISGACGAPCRAMVLL
ncbi:MAG: cyclase family protein [Chloroflexota bacterium]|nr:cyclase family protein [Chloroflexota bacterium]